MVRNFLVIPLVLLLAQKPVKKPDVHTDFQFGSYPWSRQAADLMKEDLAREIVVAYAEGWSNDKIAKQFKISTSDVSKVSDKLEDERLVGRQDEYDVRPLLPVIRERDLDRMREPLRRHTQEFTKLILDNWKEIESMVDSLEGAKGIPKGRLMYETVVSGILLGGMLDAFYEDKTLMPPPRRRAKTDRYFAWLVESNSEAAGKLRRELRESAGYRIVTIGTALAEEKLNPDDIRGKDTILEAADARKYRTFIGLFSRDKLLPYFKNRREEFLKLGVLMSSGRYIAFAEFFAWYYNTMANQITDTLIAERRIAPPEKLYTYAVKAPEQ
jgi:DNA-binding MarR family transcriptional regulator